MPARASVIVPAHNEAARIGRLLDAVAELVSNGEVTLVVVCNGCVDATAEVARSYPGVTVVELPVASKPAALNEGDCHAKGVFPRLYCDADVQPLAGAMDALIKVLSDDDRVVVAAPRVEYQRAGASWVVDQYTTALEAPVNIAWSDTHLVGRGIYGASRRARERFTTFPEVTADDLFFEAHFDPTEQVIVEDAVVRLCVAESTGELVRREIRVVSGNLEHRARAKLAGARETATGKRVVKRFAGCVARARQVRTKDAVPVAVYLAVKGWAQFVATHRRRQSRSIPWQ